MHPGEFLRQRRVALGYEPEDVANEVGLNRPSYYDLEQVDTELTIQVSLAEIARLERVLSFDVRKVLSDWSEGSKLTLQDLATAIRAQLQRTGQTLDQFENTVGWEVGPMLKSPALALEWNLDCLRDVSGGLGIPWQSVNFEGAMEDSPQASEHR